MQVEASSCAGAGAIPTCKKFTTCNSLVGGNLIFEHSQTNEVFSKHLLTRFLSAADSGATAAAGGNRGQTECRSQIRQLTLKLIHKARQDKVRQGKKSRQENLQISAKSEKSNLKKKAGREKPAAADSEFYSFTKVTTGGGE